MLRVQNSDEPERVRLIKNNDLIPNWTDTYNVANQSGVEFIDMCCAFWIVAVVQVRSQKTNKQYSLRLISSCVFLFGSLFSCLFVCAELLDETFL